MSVRNRIRQIFAEKLHVDVPRDDGDLIEGGILDSFTFVELLLSIEQAFGVTITLGSIEIDDFRSIRSIASVIEASMPPDMLAGSSVVPAFIPPIP